MIRHKNFFKLLSYSPGNTCSEKRDLFAGKRESERIRTFIFVPSNSKLTLQCDGNGAKRLM